MVGSTVGTPMVEGAAVQAEVVDQIRGEKVINYKKRRRKHSSQRKKGHRQHLTVIKVTDILEKGGDKTGVMAAIGSGAVSGFAVAAAAAPEKAPVKKKAEPKAKAEPKPKAEAKPKAEPKPKKAKAEPKEEAPAEGDFVRPANLLTEAQGTPDDLKRISGVGPKLEGVLHENGVFHFWQIAAWGATDILYMDDKLSFKGRIERDNWIAQAKEFAAEAE